MNCIKCGTELPGEQVFCDACLAEMDKYPVKPDITVTLPPRKEAPVSKKKTRKRNLPQEEQLRRVKAKLRLAHITLAVVFICFLLVVAMLLQYLYVQL
ncbi:MAG: hypothetical protein IJN60_06380 [Oscillospiraceae bacterium]|nr:hypothetical protein [Oscillospiraceae bacterium]